MKNYYKILGKCNTKVIQLYYKSVTIVTYSRNIYVIIVTY